MSTVLPFALLAVAPVAGLLLIRYLAEDLSTLCDQLASRENRSAADACS